MSKKKQEFDITGMHCAACVKRVENVVSKVDGVESVKVNLLTRKGSVEYKEGSSVDPQQIIEAITNIGFGAVEADETKQEIEKVNLKPHITDYNCSLYGRTDDDEYDVTSIWYSSIACMGRVHSCYHCSVRPWSHVL